ncbi:MAG: cobalamin-independent methionine synthase II family protein [Steroidobacteraceae bacterium]
MESSHRILTTHVGSLIRPPELVEWLIKEQNGVRLDRRQMDACLAKSVDEVVRQQAEAGIDIVSDGEFGKSIAWSMYVVNRLGGIELRTDVQLDPAKVFGGKDRHDFPEFYAEYEASAGPFGLGKQHRPPPGTFVVAGPIKYTGHAAVQADIARLKSAMSKSSVAHGFLPVVAPVSASPYLIDRHYGREEALLFGLAEALHDEYAAIVEAGLMVQIDDAFLASQYDAMVPPKSLEEYRRWAQIGVEALNHALRGIPEDRVRYHVCWGSWNGPHCSDVPLKEIADLILKVRAGGYSLEMANPRHEHEWRVWESIKLPEGKVLLPGVVAHSTNVVEHPELVAERIARLARLVGRENVIASTDCGFAQGPLARRVHPSIMWAKLAALAEGARLASRSLWGTR